MYELTVVAEDGLGDDALNATVVVTVEVEDGPQLDAPFAVNAGATLTTDGPLAVNIPLANLALATPLAISNVTLDFGDTANFTIDSFPASIAPGASGDVELTFDSGGVPGASCSPTSLSCRKRPRPTDSPRRSSPRSTKRRSTPSKHP